METSHLPESLCLGSPGMAPIHPAPSWAPLTWGTMFLKDSMILELLASW